MGDNNSDSVLDATGNTIVLAFDLAGSQIVNMPDELGKAIQKPEVQAAIQQALSKFALARQKSGTTEVSDEEAKKLGTELMDKAGGKLTDAVLEQLKKTPEFKRLEKSLSDLESALKSSPVGVWVDKNKNILYVVGAGLAIGGAVALYVTKTGGPAINFPMSKLAGKPIKVFNVGGFTLSGKVLAFKPDTREVGGALVGAEKWGKLEVSLELGVVATGDDITKVDGKLVLKTKDIDLGITGSGELQKNTVNLGITFGIKNAGGQGPFTIGVTGVLQDGKLTGGKVSGDWQLKGGASIGVEGSTGSSGTQGMVLFSKSF
jgi:hypothetical protein